MRTWSTTYSLAAGATSAIGSVLIDVHFWQAIIIAGITGVIAAIGTVLGAFLAASIAARAAERNHEVLKDVQRKVGAHRRQTDEAASSSR